MPELTGHRWKIHTVTRPTPPYREWRVQCVCGWREKAENMRDAEIRARHHVKYPNR